MKELRREHVNLPKGAAVVWFVMDVAGETTSGEPVAEVSLRAGGKTIGARLVRRCDVSESGKAQRYGIVVQSRSPRSAVAVIEGTTAVTARWARVEPSVAPAWAMSPLFGDPMRAGQWYAVRRPPFVRTVWIDPLFANVDDSAGVPLYCRVQEALWCFGRVCGLAFRQVPVSSASVCFFCGSSVEVTTLSQQWNAREWFPGQNVGSAYMAIAPGGSVIWIGNRLKTAQGSGPLSPINAVRFVLNSYLQVLGIGVYHDPRAWPWAAANANFSAPICFPRNNHGDCEGGLAGMDSYEVRMLQNRFGKPWLGRWENA